MRHAVGSYAEDNSETVKSANDDQGLPESPIYSNFSKHLWTSHTRQARMQSPNSSKASKNGPQPTGEPLPAQKSTVGKGTRAIKGKDVKI